MELLRALILWVSGGMITMAGEEMKRRPKVAELTDRDITERIIAAAISVHKALGPGFMESVYEEALCVELRLRGIVFERQRSIPLVYRDCPVGEHRLDLLVEGRVVVELKAARALDDVFFAQVRSYMKAIGTESGLLLNFASMPLTIKRVAREWHHGE